MPSDALFGRDDSVSDRFNRTCVVVLGLIVPPRPMQPAMPAASPDRAWASAAPHRAPLPGRLLQDVDHEHGTTSRRARPPSIRAAAGSRSLRVTGTDSHNLPNEGELHLPSAQGSSKRPARRGASPTLREAIRGTADDLGSAGRKTADDQPKRWPSRVVGTGVDPVTFRFFRNEPLSRSDTARSPYARWPCNVIAPSIGGASQRHLWSPARKEPRPSLRPGLRPRGGSGWPPPTRHGRGASSSP
jgi:hypothetical protein